MSQKDTDRTKKFMGIREWSPAIKPMDNAFENSPGTADETGETGSNAQRDVVN